MRLSLFFAAFCLLASCGKKPPSQPNEVEVTTLIVERQTIPANLEFVGVAESSHLVEIRSRVEGYLWKIAYTEGSFVKEGDLLFQIDPRQFEAAVNEAKGVVEREKAVLWAAERAVERFKPLYDQKAASRRDLDNATAREMAGQASVESARAKLQEAELNLSYTSIQSPIAGLSGRAKYREGTLITPSINGLLTTVAIVDPIWVIFSVADSYLLKSNEELKKNLVQLPPNDDFNVFLTLSDGSQFPHHGKVNFTSPTLDQNTGTMTVRAVFPNPDKLVRPGQFVRATVVGATRPNAIAIPQQSVQQGEKGMFVYVVNQDQQAEIRWIQVGDWYDNFWIIQSGLEVGDEVIVSGVNKVSQGTPVKVMKKPQSQDKESSKLDLYYKGIPT